MKRRDKKKIMIIGGAVSLVLLITMASVAIFSGKSELEEEKIPGLEEFGEDFFDLSVVNVMVEDEQTLYWDISVPSNSTDIIVITGVQILMTWSDDENPPAFRPTYANTPDTFILSVEGIPLLGNGGGGEGDNSTNVTTTGVIRIASISNMGNTRVNLDALNNPILLKTTGNGSSNTTAQSEWEEGASEPGDTGLFINVTCIAGDIVSNRPALLMYTDNGDEVTMTIKVFYKSIPQEVLDNWIELNSRAETGG